MSDDGHVLAIAELGAALNGRHVLYESKLLSPLTKSVNLGNGTARGGGTPSTAAGDLVAFGCTEESMLYKCLGAKPRGVPNGAPFDPSTGLGWVEAHQGDYHDAIARKDNVVHVLLAETLGGITSYAHHILRALATDAQRRDATVYGDYMYSTGNFYDYHSGAISIAIIRGWCNQLEKGISKVEAQMLRAA